MIYPLLCYAYWILPLYTVRSHVIPLGVLLMVYMATDFLYIGACNGFISYSTLCISFCRALLRLS